MNWCCVVFTDVTVTFITIRTINYRGVEVGFERAVNGGTYSPVFLPDGHWDMCWKVVGMVDVHRGREGRRIGRTVSGRHPATRLSLHSIIEGIHERIGRMLLMDAARC
jgi:hypothetical protein